MDVGMLAPVHRLQERGEPRDPLTQPQLLAPPCPTTPTW
jgi:hypothetical protein